MATKNITVNGIKLPYTETKTTTGVRYDLTFKDGTKVSITTTGAEPTDQQKQDAYIKAAMTNHPPVSPTNPITPPVVIPPKGTTRNITVQDLAKLNGSDGEVLAVTGAITDQCQPTNCNNTTIDLSAVTATVKGVPVFEMQGINNGTTIKGGSFKDCDAGIVSYRWDKLFDGTDKSVIKGLVLSGQTADNCGPLFVNWGSKITSQGLQGVIRGLQVLNLVFKNSGNVSNIVLAECLEDYLIQDGAIDNINFGNALHNGIFSVGGNGLFQRMKCTNHMGNVFRSRPYNVMGTDKSVVCTQSIGIGSTRYSFSEAQVMPDDLKLYPKLVPIKSFSLTNNITGNLSSDKQRNGGLMDKYPVSLTPAKENFFDVSGNIGFNWFALDGNLNNGIFLQGGAIMPNMSNNKYYATSALAQAAGVSVS